MQASPVSNEPWRYGAPAILLHWILALLLVAMAVLGWVMMSIEDQPGSDWYFDLHKSLGVVVATLVLLRIGWRLGHRPAPLPSDIPNWQTRLSGGTQGLMYVLMLAIPVVGYLGASFSKAGVRWFGVGTPRWAVPDHDLSEQLFDLHGVLVWVLVALVVTHALGALRHLRAGRGDVVRRMWFRTTS